MGFSFQIILASLPNLYTEYIYPFFKRNPKVLHSVVVFRVLKNFIYYKLIVLAFFLWNISRNIIDFINWVSKTFGFKYHKSFDATWFFLIPSLLCQEMRPVYKLHMNLLCNGYEQVLMKFESVSRDRSFWPSSTPLCSCCCAKCRRLSW